jgi:hypothetical protein
MKMNNFYGKKLQANFYLHMIRLYGLHLAIKNYTTWGLMLKIVSTARKEVK